MSESGSGAAVDEITGSFPADVRTLKDFPCYDSSLQDGPQFRQRVHTWANRTEKAAGVLTNLSAAFSDFHSTGVKHYESACRVLNGLQKLASVYEGCSPTISASLNQFCESMNRIWCYFDAFLGQTQMLTVEPISKLAKSFTNLKLLHDEVVQYRKEYTLAADRMCACRHISKLTDPHQFSQLAEACYSAQKTYSLVLSKYIVCVREAHTTDMMNFMRRIIEHLLSAYSHHNFSTQVLRDIEPEVNVLFSNTKHWRSFYVEEQKKWVELQRHVHDHVISTYQHHVNGIPVNMDHTHGRLAEVGKHVLKPLKKMIPTHPSPTATVTRPLAHSESAEQWTIVQLPSANALASSGVPEQKEETGVASELTVSTGAGGGGETNKDQVIQNSKQVVTVPVNFTELPSPVGGFHRKLRLMRSNSDPDVLLSKRPNEDLDKKAANDADHQLTYEMRSVESREMCRSLSHNDLILEDSCVEPLSDHPFSATEASLESAAAKIEQVINQTKPRRPILSMLKDLKHSRSRKRVSSVTSRDKNSDTSVPQSPVTPDHTTGTRRRRKFLGRSKSIGTKKVKEDRHKSRHHPGVAATSATSIVDKEENKHSEYGHDGSHISPVSSSNTVDKDEEDDEDQTIPNVSSSSSCERPPSITPVGDLACDISEGSTSSVLQLIKPQCSTWIMSGYLMLRMKLPNNRYAWSFIYCVVDKELGQLMIQEQNLHEPRELEDLQLCGVKIETPSYIDRNFCFRVISPTGEHLFQALTENDLLLWIAAIQEGIAEAIKTRDTTRPDKRRRSGAISNGNQLPHDEKGGIVADAMKQVLSIPGNTQCADCNSSDVQWASINLGISLCIECSGVHRGLGVHVSKVRSLNLDKWDSSTIQFMQAQGNTKSNCYYEARLGKGYYADIKKPSTNSSKSDRMQYIQLKYVTLAFIPELAEPTTTNSSIL